MDSISKILNLGRGERILLMVRQSLWVWFWPIVLAGALIIAPVFAMYPLFKIGIWGGIIFAILVVWGLLLFLKIYLCHANTVFVLTNYRVADIDQKGFIDRTAVEIPYEKIKSIQQFRHGFGNLILGLGDIYVLLTDGKSKIKLSKIHNFKAVAHDIFLCRRNYFNNKQKLADN